MRDELERRVVGPLQVVEQHEHRRGGGELLEQRADRAMGAIALVLQRGGRCGARGADGGQHARELGDAVAEHPLDPLGAEPGDVVVERVDPHAERQVLLELGAAAGQDDAVALLPAAGELLQHAGLADAGLAAQRDEAGIAPERLQRRRHRRELAPATDQGALLRDGRHSGTVTRGDRAEGIRPRRAQASRRTRATALRPRYRRLMIVPSGTPSACAASA